MTWILTYPHGERFNVATPDPAKIHLEDVAHALSRTCRFAGHINREHYSVAQHCYHVSCLAVPEYAQEALMHDAPEAYIHDITRPLKQLLTEYQSLERLHWAAIALRFSLPLNLPRVMHNYDMILLATERKQLCVSDPEPWDCLAGVRPLQCTLPTWGPNKAKEMFLDRAAELGIR